MVWNIRPREKFIKSGVSSLTVKELLSIIVGSGVHNYSYLKVSARIVKVLSGLESDGEGVRKELTKVRGVGVAKALKILAGIELGRRFYSLHSSTRKVIPTTKDCISMLEEIAHQKKEHVMVLFLNARFELLGKEVVSVGSVSSAGLLPRDVIIPALELNSSHIILAHNHPSGNSKPSEEDIRLTLRIREACNIIGIVLLDHIVISSSGWSSVPT